MPPLLIELLLKKSKILFVEGMKTPSNQSSPSPLSAFHLGHLQSVDDRQTLGEGSLEVDFLFYCLLLPLDCV